MHNIANTLRTSISRNWKGVWKFFSPFLQGVALISMLLSTFHPTEAFAAPFSKQIDGAKVDIAIDKGADTMKEIYHDIRDGKTDKVIDKVAATAKEISKEAGNKAKQASKDLKEGTKNNLETAAGKVKGAVEGADKTLDKSN